MSRARDEETPEPLIVVFRPTTDRTPTQPIPADILDTALELCRNGDDTPTTPTATER